MKGALEVKESETDRRKGGCAESGSPTTLQVQSGAAARGQGEGSRWAPLPAASPSPAASVSASRIWGHYVRLSPTRAF